MDQLPSFGTAIQDIVLPTFKAYTPLLLANAELISSVKKESHQYASHERQMLDVYTPPAESPKGVINGRRPVLLFTYGGGFINGARTLPVADGLAHANIGAFFASKFGYTVVIPDYRLLSHGAKFPSGGEDMALAVEWVLKNKPGPDATASNDKIDLFLMGNSAGGVHIATFLLHPSFADTRAKVLSPSSPIRLRAATFLSVPFSFSAPHPSRIEILETYYGKDKAWESLCPLGLLQSAVKEAKPSTSPFDFVNANVRLLVLNGELDPADEIMQPRDEFVSDWFRLKDPKSVNALGVDMMSRHNHISPPFSLGTGNEEEEAWGWQVGGFFENARKFYL